MRKLRLIPAFLLCFAAAPVSAQINSSGDGNAVPQLQNPAEETIEIGLSTETIAITSNFGGTDLTIFGALDNADPMIQRQDATTSSSFCKARRATSWCARRTATSVSG